MERTPYEQQIIDSMGQPIVEPKDPWVFGNMGPSETDPITSDSFERLQSVIETVNQSVGIVNSSYTDIRRNDYLAESEGTNEEQAIKVGIYYGPKNLVSLSVELKLANFTTRISVRNDAGTVSNFRQIGANMSKVDEHGRIWESTGAMTEVDIGNIIELVHERAEQRRFVKKYQPAVFMTPFFLQKDDKV